MRIMNKLVALEGILELVTSQGNKDKVFDIVGLEGVDAKLVWFGLFDFIPGGALASGRKIVIEQVCCNSVSGEPGGGGELELSLQEVVVIDEGLKAKSRGGGQVAARSLTGGQGMVRKPGVNQEVRRQQGGGRRPGCGQEASRRQLKRQLETRRP